MGLGRSGRSSRSGLGSSRRPRVGSGGRQQKEPKVGRRKRIGSEENMGTAVADLASELIAEDFKGELGSKGKKLGDKKDIGSKKDIGTRKVEAGTLLVGDVVVLGSDEFVVSAKNLDGELSITPVSGVGKGFRVPGKMVVEGRSAAAGGVGGSGVAARGLRPEGGLDSRPKSAGPAVEVAEERSQERARDGGGRKKGFTAANGASHGPEHGAKSVAGQERARAAGKFIGRPPRTQA